MMGLSLILVSISCAKHRVGPASAAPSGVSSSSTATHASPPRDQPEPSDAEPVARVGTKFRYTSAILRDERAYWVDLPESYDAASGAQARYPVLYLLDAERFFAQASTTVKFMSGQGSIPEMILVGIPSTAHRTRDMTPTHSLTGPNGEPTQRAATSGGGPAFLSSLEKELFPLIEARYRTMPYRILVGHSLSGLFALHALLEAPASFHATIAMDPSLWWDGHLLAKRAAASFSTAKTLKNTVYIGAANHDNDPDGQGPKAATQAFYQAIKSVPSPNLRCKLQSFEDENHGSVAFPSFYYGLAFAFNGYQLATLDRVEDPATIVAHYRQFSEKRGVTFEPPEAAFAIAGFVLLFQQKKIDRAIAVLEENVKRHPLSPAAHEYLGEAYLAKNDAAAAIRSFERALELKPGDEEATKHLQKALGK
jgi:predicted alpha/beta superfamily hydrolase